MIKKEVLEELTMLEKQCYDSRNDCPHGSAEAYKSCILLGDCPYTKGDI